MTIPVPKEQIEEEERARRFSSRGHWELSTAVTTNHLLSVIALANTLMSMNSATFVPEQEKRRKLHRWESSSSLPAQALCRFRRSLLRSLLRSPTFALGAEAGARSFSPHGSYNGV